MDEVEDWSSDPGDDVLSDYGDDYSPYGDDYSPYWNPPPDPFRDDAETFISNTDNMQAYYRGRPLIHHALVHGAPIEIIKMILEKDPSTANQLDSDGSPPLMYAVNRYEYTELLYRYGAHACSLNEKTAFEEELARCLDHRHSANNIALHLQYGAVIDESRLEKAFQRAYNSRSFMHRKEKIEKLTIISDLIVNTWNLLLFLRGHYTIPKPKLLLPKELYRQLKTFLM